jgi:serpin B
MKYIFLLVLFFILIAGSSCKKDQSETLKEPVVSYTANEKMLLQSSNQFGIGLFCNLADDYTPTKNLFISPLSIYLALTMTYNGAAGQTAVEMQNTLGFNGMSKEDINQSCKNIVDIILHLDPRVTMEIANSIWYRNTFSVKSDFLTLNQHYFNAGVNACNFEDPATVSLINDWVKTGTHGKIEKVLDNIPDNSLMYLINAIYFKGTWKYKFDNDKTVINTFYTGDKGSIEANFMVQKATYKYLEDDLLSAIELSYGNSGFSMVVLLPKAGKGVSDIVESITPAKWLEWCDNMNLTDITVKMPRFKFSYDSVVNESLKTMGMPKAFKALEADFSNITEAYQLFISKVLHKSFVEVNEDGTEAAAVTVVDVGFTSIEPGVEKYFVANKPFMFVIKENSSQTILFSGIVNNPVTDK